MGVCKYEFVTVEESDYDNPWKESFKQLYHGVHVRPGFQENILKYPSRYKGNFQHFISFESCSPYLEYSLVFKQESVANLRKSWKKNKNFIGH